MVRAAILLSGTSLPVAACPQAGVIKSGKTIPMDNNHREVLDISLFCDRIRQADVAHFFNQPMLTHILAGVNEGLHRT